MVIQRSEEQWKDLKLKITLAVIVAIVGASVYGVGPGLDKFAARELQHAKEPGVAKKIYNIGRMYEATWREKKALDLYQKAYYVYAGDESKLQGIAQAQDETKMYEDSYALIPFWAGGRPQDSFTEGQAPDPVMGDILMRVGRWQEDQRNYGEMRYLYKCVMYCFPGSAAAKEAELGIKRDLGRSM
jgi:hypothetical protein